MFGISFKFFHAFYVSYVLVPNDRASIQVPRFSRATLLAGEVRCLLRDGGRVPKKMWKMCFAVSRMSMFQNGTTFGLMFLFLHTICILICVLVTGHIWSLADL